MEKCKDCKWWNEDHKCEMISECIQNKAEVVAYADDDSGLCAYLKTDPEFGCVLFLKKKDLT